MKSAPSAPACASPPSAQEGDDCGAGLDDEERRCRLLRRALSSFGGISVIYFLGILAVDGRPMSPIGYVATFNTVCCIFLYAYLANSACRVALWRTAVLFAVMIDVTIFFLGLVYTEPYSDVTHWLLLVPIHLLFVVGKRAGVVATLVVFIQALIIYLHHYLHPNQTFFATSPASTFHVSIMGRSLNMLSYLVIVSSVSFAYEDARCVALSSLSRLNARLQKATLAKAQFLANMTHELRTPMHGIISMAKDLLECSQLDARGREAAQIISDSSDHLLSLVNNILDYESVETHQLVMEHIPFSLSKETNKVVNLLAVLANQKDVRLEKDVLAHYDMHLGDPLRFRQVLYNLVSNAIKFTPECGHVGVYVFNNEDEPDKVVVEVRDTGIGIDKCYRNSLFKVFSQSSPDIRRKFGGSGLGLAICKGLCEAMGGDISYSSVPGEGTTFTCHLVLPHSTRDLDFEEEQCGGLRVAETKAQRQVLEGVKILLVEDNPISQMVGVRLLTKLGVAVKVASDGHECLDIVQGEKFDAILMDCHMPKMDGFQATRAIRALEASGVMTRKLARRKKKLRRARSVLPASQANSAGDDDAESSNETTSGRVNKNDNSSRREANVDDDDDADEEEDGRDGLSSPSAEFAGFSSGDGPPAPPETDVRLRGAGRRAERRRWLKGVHGVPIIALTASATSDVQRQCFECGMNDFLQKPFQKEDFVQVLQEWATRGGGGANPPSAERREQEGARIEGARSPALEG